MSIATPWGPSQTADIIAPGVTFVTTAGHGGYHLDAERNAMIPADWRAVSFNSQATAGWYEEDCDWCMVALTFPTAFPTRAAEQARKTFDHWIAPKLAARQSTPWTVEHGCQVYDARSRQVCDCGADESDRTKAEQKALAALIVRAVNAHCG